MKILFLSPETGKMESAKIEELKKSWGDKPCIHPALKKATNTSDKVCTVCGRVVYSGKLKSK